jgi:hypothetical protein
MYCRSKYKYNNKWDAWNQETQNKDILYKETEKKTAFSSTLAEITESIELKYTKNKVWKIWIHSKSTCSSRFTYNKLYYNS